MAQPQSQPENSAEVASPAPPARASAGGAGHGPLDSPPETNEREQFRGFLDLPIEVSVQMGRKPVKFRELLELDVDTVIRMEKSAGENVDLLLEDLTVGRGEIIVIEDMMGLRITDLTSAGTDREQEAPQEA